jgi:serine/threonine protein phosphatase 1
MTSSRVSFQIFAIGDIHGCAEELKALLAKLKITKNDTVVFLGDYVDRGPDTRGVVDTILKLSKTCNVVALKGNHEAMFLDFLERPDSPGAGIFILNGGGATLANYTHEDGSIEIPDEHMDFYRNLKLSYQTDKYFFVHAGVPDQPLSTLNDKEHEMAMLWSRHPFLGSDYSWEKLVIHGHTPVTEVELRKNRINLDTGCVYDGKLTAIELSSTELSSTELAQKTLHQVSRIKKMPALTYPREQNSARISTRFSGRIPVTAWHKGYVGGTNRFRFETLNFNQFGLLMKVTEIENTVDFEAGDEIEGQIGDEVNKAIQFFGKVVRVESRGPLNVYGVRIERLSGDAQGEGSTSGTDEKKSWVDRPGDT